MQGERPAKGQESTGYGHPAEVGTWGVLSISPSNRGWNENETALALSQPGIHGVASCSHFLKNDSAYVSST